MKQAAGEGVQLFPNGKQTKLKLVYIFSLQQGKVMRKYCLEHICAKKHRENRKKLPENISSVVKVWGFFFILRYVIITTVTIRFFAFCPNLSFWVFSQFEFLSFWVWSQYEFLSLVTFWVFEFCKKIEFLSFVTICVFEFCHNLCFWILSQFEFSSFVTNCVF